MLNVNSATNFGRSGSAFGCRDSGVDSRVPNAESRFPCWFVVRVRLESLTYVGAHLSRRPGLVFSAGRDAFEGDRSFWGVAAPVAAFFSRAARFQSASVMRHGRKYTSSNTRECSGSGTAIQQLLLAAYTWSAFGKTSRERVNRKVSPSETLLDANRVASRDAAIDRLINMKPAGVKISSLINFNNTWLKDGVRHFVL
jgi:hypothetical protein